MLSKIASRSLGAAVRTSSTTSTTRFLSSTPTLFTATEPNSSVSGRESALFTPGPLTTSIGVKQAMQVDLGSRDSKFIDVIQSVRDELLGMARTSQADGHECVLMQGSGTFCVESVISSVIPASGKLLVLSNGAYGERIGQMCKIHKIDHEVISYGERGAPNAADAAAAVLADPSITHVACIHHETTSGALNPAQAIGAAIKEVSERSEQQPKRAAKRSEAKRSKAS